MGGPWEKYGAGGASGDGPWAKYDDSASKTPDNYVRSSELRAKNYQTADTSNPDVAILKKHGFRDDEIARLMKDKTYAPGAFQELDDLFGKGSRGGEAQATPIGRVSQGLTNIAMKGAQIGSRLPFSAQGPEMTDAIARIKAQQIEANRNPDDMRVLGMDPLEAAGQMLVPVPGAGLGRSVGMLGKVGGAMVRGAAAGAMQPQSDVQYDTQGNSNFGSGLAKQAAVGAVVGPALEGAVGGASKLVAKLRGAKAGVLPPEMQARVDLANKYGLDLSAGDISQNQAIKGAEDASTYMMGGMSKYRGAENLKAKAAAEKMVAGLKAKMKALGYEDLDAIQAAANAGGTDAPNANRILAEIQKAGDNPYVVAAVSRDSKLFGQQLKARGMESEVLKGAAQTGDVAPTNLLDTMKRMEADPKIPDIVKAEIKKQKGTVESQQIGPEGRLSGASEPSYSGVDHLGGGEPTVSAQETVVGPRMSKEQRSFDSIWGLKRHFDQMAQPTSATGFSDPSAAAASKAFGDLKRAAQADLEAHAAATNPELSTKLGEYNKFYKDTVGPNQTSKLAKKFNGIEQPEGLIDAFVKANEDGSGRWFYDALDEKGRAAVRAHIASEAVGAGVSPPSAITPSIQTGKVASALDKLSPKMEGEPAVIPEFFKGQDRAEIDGFAKLMRLVERNGPKESSTGLINALKLGAAKTVGGAAGIVGMGPLTKWLFTSPAGKKLLLSASKNPESAQTKMLLKVLQNQANRLGAMSSAKTSPMEEEN